MDRLKLVVDAMGYMHNTAANSITPFRVCQEAVKNIDFTNFDQVILDPACGKGTFLLAAMEGFLNAGCPVDHLVNNIIHGYDISPTQVRHTISNILKVTGIRSKNIIVKDFMTEETTMKIDFIGTNPPYKGQSRLHQQFFNKAVDLVADGGQVVFLQPGIAYFNKKDKTDNPSQLMRDNIKRYKTTTKFINPRVFDNAIIANDLSITFLTKVEANEEIESVTYASGAEYKNVKLENVSKTEMNPFMYESIVTKYKAFIDKHGHLEDIISTDKTIEKVKIAWIRGNVFPGTDWYTFVPDEDFIRYTHDGWGVPTNGDTDYAEAVVHNLKLTSMRFGLAMYKFSTDMSGGAMRGTPLIDFGKKHTDAEVYELLGITEEEQAEINRVIPKYYDK